MKTIMKKSLCFLIGLFILFSLNCYIDAASTTQQKKAEEWFKKAYNADTPTLQIEYYSKAIDINPKYADAYNNRGVTYGNLGEHLKATIDFSKTIELNPKYAQDYYTRGVAYALLKVFTTEACDDFYQAGILFLEQDNTDQALLCVDQMKKVDPSSPLINKLMDQIYP